jgi:hypothetical protein
VWVWIVVFRFKNEQELRNYEYTAPPLKYLQPTRMK